MPEEKLKCYLLAFSDVVGTHDEVKRYIDSRREIKYWSTYIRNTFFIVTDLTASDLADLILEYTKKKGRFIIVDTASESNGWLPGNVWKRIRIPEKFNEYRPK